MVIFGCMTSVAGRIAAAGVFLLLTVPGLDAGAQRSTGDAWRINPLPQATLIFANDGSLAGEIGRELRTSISIRSLPRYVPQAFVSVEDQRFYQHNGVDLIGIAGAIKDDILGDRRESRRSGLHG